MTTKLILTHDVSHLGSAGEVVEVKDGYARNYLLPRKLATPWTKGAQRQIDQMAEARRKRSIESLEHAQTARAWLQENVVTVSATAGDNGRLFGAVTTATLAEASRPPVAPPSTVARSRSCRRSSRPAATAPLCACTPTSWPLSRSTSSPLAERRASCRRRAGPPVGRYPARRRRVRSRSRRAGHFSRTPTEKP